MTRKICPYCGHIYTAFRVKSKACSRTECQRARARDTRLEREAKKADMALKIYEWHRKIWISRKRNAAKDQT